MNYSGDQKEQNCGFGPSRLINFESAAAAGEDKGDDIAIPGNEVERNGDFRSDAESENEGIISLRAGVGY